MDVPRILIVEDDPLMALHLETLIGETLGSDIVTAASVAEAWTLVDRRPDYAMLDVDVADGTTYPIASWLLEQCVPFAFLSASDRALLPSDLRDATFVAKPYDDNAIVALLEAFARDFR